jgi:erythromycin esterase-like protein
LSLVDALRPLGGSLADDRALVEAAGRAAVVLIGEASHGTHEFYRERAELTKALIAHHGVTIVSAEADWPDAYRVNVYVRGAGEDESAAAALSDFRRFPAWMWRNREVVDFVEWLREWNASLPGDVPKTGFYGLDLYSLHASMEAVVRYLEEVDPDAAARARERYSCFDHFGADPQAYGFMTARGVDPCEQEAVKQLVELLRMAAEDDRILDDDRHFYATQNARLVVNAEEYYRSIYRGHEPSWNLRDRHMTETLEALLEHHGGAKAAVWAHNSHVGDARATEMSRRGELNVGQLVRERHGADSFSLGFTTYAGTVTAASDWGAIAERKQVRAGLPGSWEATFHETGVPRFLADTAELAETRLERAIGVIYRPDTERQSHYFHARLDGQFDAVAHLDETRAVEPLEVTSVWEEGELPETYPWAV